MYLKPTVVEKKNRTLWSVKETYPSVFIVELDQDKHNFERVSYTYTDVLTENVQVSFEEDNHQEVVAH